MLHQNNCQGIENTNKTENYSVEIKTTGNESSRQNGYTVDFFPEGGSHDRPDLLPIKAGISIMALGFIYKI
jgi:glycerol-3-phosphate O-acyltransferase/dihydroxyacetone phosphate acyltransferase